MKDNALRGSTGGILLLRNVSQEATCLCCSGGGSARLNTSRWTQLTLPMKWSYRKW